MILASTATLIARISIALIVAAAISAAAGASTPTHSDWNARAEAAIARLTPALDTARTNPSAAKPSLTLAIAELTSLIASAPASDRDLAILAYNRGLAHAALADSPAALLDFRTSDALLPSNAASAQIDAMRRRLRQQESRTRPPEGGSTPSNPDRTFGESVWRYARSLPAAPLWYGGLGVLAVGWCCVGAAVFGPPRTRRKPWVLSASLLLGAGSLAIALFAACRISPAARNDVVVLSERCRAFEGPDSITYPARSFEGIPFFPRGRELRVIEVQDLADQPGWPAWLRVRPLDSGRAAGDVPDFWIRAADAAWVRPTGDPAAAPAPPLQTKDASSATNATM
ncbi:MAG: hypothetical protein IT438_16630 [Phycisphaerales bacterium]|nr:hypothetical protein [Phycisphaerales bacterium]